MSDKTDREELLRLVQRLDESQWLPEPQRRARQLDAATLLLRHAVRSVPYFAPLRDVLPADGRALTADEWRRLPLLSRRDLQQRGDELLSREIPPPHLPTEPISTSGSTGAPVTVTITQATHLMWHALGERTLAWYDTDFSGRAAAIRISYDMPAPYPQGKPGADWGWPTALLRRTGEGALLDVRTDVELQLEWLQRQRPSHLLTYPSNAQDLGRLMAARGMRLPTLRQLRLFGEAVYPEQLATLRQQFGVPAWDVYSTSELGYVASQCPASDLYHVHGESVLVEVLADDGRPCAPGEVGRVVITALHNYATALIRYDIGDHAEVAAPCPCGRGLPALRRILGRTRNMLTVPGGGRQWPYFGARGWRALAPVLQVQVVQHEPDRLEARLVVERPLQAAELEQLRQLVVESCGYPFRIDFSFHERLERSASGKFEDFKSLLGQPA